MVENRSKVKKGFTLIELLVVIAIIAILAAILFPVISNAKNSARKARCCSNLKQINSALLMYVDDNGGRFPGGKGMDHCRIWAAVFPGYSSGGVSSGGQINNARGPYMQVVLRPYVKNNAVWLCPSVKENDPVAPAFYGNKDVFQGYTWADNNGGMVAGKWIDIPTNYLWNHLWRIPSDWNKANYISGHLTSEVVRPSKALMFMECPYWASTKEAAPHGGNGGFGVQCSFFDGHVAFINCGSNAYYLVGYPGWTNEKG